MPRPYPPEFRARAIALVRAGKQAKQTAVELATNTYCPCKGGASYYSLALADGVRADAVWFYPEPYDAVADIAGHVAFYTDQVDLQAGA
ncbi:DUF427 domain-containing protein [Streptomyces sp. NBC_00988]|nr:DUF427 domain-containing protein [Streptomyces sp. NBC_00988]